VPTGRKLGPSSARRRATWASLHARLVTIPGIWKKDPEPLRRFVEAVAYVLRTGVAWEDLPATFGEVGTVDRRFRRWACKGIWDELFIEGLPTDARETVMLDSTACKAQRFASGARGGGEEAGAGAQPGRPDHQAPCARRWPGPPLVLPADPRTGR
jgi:transposase